MCKRLLDCDSCQSKHIFLCIISITKRMYLLSLCCKSEALHQNLSMKYLQYWKTLTGMPFLRFFKDSITFFPAEQPNPNVLCIKIIIKYSGHIWYLNTIGVTNVCKMSVKLDAYSIYNISQTIWQWSCLVFILSLNGCNLNNVNRECSNITSKIHIVQIW